MALNKDDLLAEARSAVVPVDASAAEAMLAQGLRGAGCARAS